MDLPFCRYKSDQVASLRLQTEVKESMTSMYCLSLCVCNVIIHKLCDVDMAFPNISCTSMYGLEVRTNNLSRIQPGIPSEKKF